EEESFCENIQNLCTKRSVYFDIHIHPTYIYCTHARTHTRTHTHPWDLTH
ncbi:hypothetical protein N309_10274, partial [Tinamus guttatus]